MHSLRVGHYVTCAYRATFSLSRTTRSAARYSARPTCIIHNAMSTKPVIDVSNNGASSSSSTESAATQRPQPTNPSTTAISSEETVLQDNKDISSTSHEPISDPDRVTVFVKPADYLVNINLKPGETQVSLFFKKTSELVNINIREKFQTDRLPERKEPEPSDLKLNSIEERRWKEMTVESGKLLDVYLKLAKIRLTGLVVVTTMAGYALAPGVFDPLVLAACTVGTAMTSASANAVNQYLEVPFDSQMNRTKNRPLVRGQISSLHAIAFALTSATTGLAMLTFGVNTLTASLGAFNLLLYTIGYTPMKRLSVANTWIGAVVGGIPPVMGWAAATGTLDPGAWLLGAILFAWQFPHFCALSWNLRPDYSRAGYRMASVINPGLCKRTSLRYSVGMIGLCTMAPVVDLTTWTFAVDSLPLNVYLAYLSWRFYKDGDSKSSRKLFRFSLVHIPALMILMLVSKKHYGEKKEGAGEKRTWDLAKQNISDLVSSFSRSS